MTFVVLIVLGLASIVASFVTAGLFAGVLTILGVFVGILAGLELRPASRIYHDSLQGEHHMPHPVTGFRHLMHRLHLPDVWFIYVIAIAQAVIAALLLYVLVDFQSYQKCMANWQQQSTISTQVRADAAAEVSKRMDDIVLSIPERDRTAFGDAVQEYLAERKRQITDREKNPLPPLPETVCGEL